LEDLLDGGMIRVVVVDIDGAIKALSAAGMEYRRDAGGIVVDAEDGSEIVKVLTASGIYPSEVRPERTSLESVFLGITGGETA
jgi:hypothetical protein